METIEEILAKLCPEPSREDEADMLAISFAASRIVSRRALTLESELGRARAQIAKLIAAQEGQG